MKYADVVSGGQGMKFLVRLTGGRNAQIMPAFLIFHNQGRNYPIKGVPDNVPGACYRTQPKGWMDRNVFLQWLQGPRAISKDVYGREKVIFLDNAAGHGETEEQQTALEKLKASLRFLPPNSTDVCQPCDSFVIQKLKERWVALWDEKKATLLTSPEWVEGRGSGKLPNPGKRFFLKLAATVVRDVNKMRDDNGISYARKAMLRCGLSLDISGEWRVEQLFLQLQDIIRRHREHFDGKSVEENEIEGYCS